MTALDRSSFENRVAALALFFFPLDPLTELDTAKIQLNQITFSLLQNICPHYSVYIYIYFFFGGVEKKSRVFF